MKPKTRSRSASESTKKTDRPSKVAKRKETTKISNAKVRSKKGMRTGSAELSAYFRSYKGGLGDFHLPVFRALKKFTSATKLLYPGCHRHITASLVFPHVLYVDNYAKIKSIFSDEKVMAFIRENKEYPMNPEIQFKCKNFESDFGAKAGSFEILMSLSAGIVSKSCGKYLKPGGYLLASDAHYDARMAYVDPRFEFVAVFDDAKSDFDGSDAAKKGHFITESGIAMTEEMVQESIDKPKAKRSFKLQKETLFYIFKKT